MKIYLIFINVMAYLIYNKFTNQGESMLNTDWIEYSDVPFYGILGGILFVFFIAFSLYWTIDELFL